MIDPTNAFQKQFLERRRSAVVLKLVVTDGELLNIPLDRVDLVCVEAGV